MTNISSSQKLNIILPNTNKALSQVLANATPKELETLSQSKDLKSIMNTILQQSAKNNNSNTYLLELVKNNPTLKNLGDATSNLKDLLNTFKSDKNLQPIENQLKNFLTDISKIKDSPLKQKFENSGVFLESKLKHSQENVKDIISNDLKAILLKAQEEVVKSSSPNQSEILKHLDKLSLQIDYHQLLSHLSDASSLYLPFDWDDLKEGSIALKKSKDDKFYCDINLKLKEFGEVNLKLILYEKNQINIHIYSSSNQFKELVKENLSTLRSALIDTKITPREIRIFEPKEKILPYQQTNDDFKMGFEVKG